MTNRSKNPNESSQKQTRKKKSQHFQGNQTENFPKKPQHNNEQKQQPQYLKYNILGIQNFPKKSRLSIKTNTKKIRGGNSCSQVGFMSCCVES